MEIKVAPPTVHNGLTKKTTMGLSVYFKILDYLYDNNLIEMGIIEEMPKKSSHLIMSKNTKKEDINAELMDKHIDLVERLTNENLKLTGMVVSTTERLLESKSSRKSYIHS